MIKAYSHHPWKERNMIWTKPNMFHVNLQGCTWMIIPSYYNWGGVESVKLYRGEQSHLQLECDLLWDCGTLDVPKTACITSRRSCSFEEISFGIWGSQDLSALEALAHVQTVDASLRTAILVALGNLSHCSLLSSFFAQRNVNVVSVTVA